MKNPLVFLFVIVIFVAMKRSANSSRSSERKLRQRINYYQKKKLIEAKAKYDRIEKRRILKSKERIEKSRASIKER